MDYIEITKQKLEVMGENYDVLSSKIQGYLDGIEAFLDSKHVAQNKAVEDLKASDYSISEVADYLQCARRTIYNNPILKAYIEYSMELDAKNNPFKIAEEIRLSRQELQERVRAMEIRDVQTEILKAENKLLMDKIADQQKEIERLQNRVHELSGELHRQIVPTSKTNKSTIAFNPTNK